MVVLLHSSVGISDTEDLAKMHSKVRATSVASSQFSARVTGRRKLASRRVSLQRRQVIASKHVLEGGSVASTRRYAGPGFTPRHSDPSHRSASCKINCNAYEIPF